MHHSWPATPGAPDRRRASGYLKGLVLKTSYSLFYSLFVHDMIGGGLGMGAPRAPSLCPLCPYLHNPTRGFTQRYKKGTRCTVSVRFERYLPTFIASSLLLFPSSFSQEVSASTPPLFAFSCSRHSDVGEGRALVGRMSGPTSIIVCSSLRLLGGIMTCPRAS